jgi:hypothetical protein
MSTWFRDDPNPQLLMEAKQIAWEFLERSGEIDDPGELNQFLIGKIEQMIGQGQRNRLALSNRAIAAFREYRRARTIELALLSIKRPSPSKKSMSPASRSFRKGSRVPK